LIYVILRERRTKPPVLAAVVTLEGQQVRLTANSKLLVQLLESVFSFPTKIKERTPEGVFKRAPKSAEENLISSLKQNLYYPYRIGHLKETAEPSKILKYKKVYPANILYGETRHEQSSNPVARAV